MTTRLLEWRAAEPETWQADDCGPAHENVTEDFSIITRNPSIFGGASVIAGTRVPVFIVQDLHEEGADVQTLMQYYPHLSEGEILTALAYASVYAGIITGDRASYESAARRYGDPE